MEPLPIFPLVQAVRLCPAGKRRVICFLAALHDVQSGRIETTMAEIAVAARLSKVQTRKHVHALIKDGLLRVVANAHGGAPGTAPRYALDRGHLEQLAARNGDLFAEPVRISGPTHRFMSEGRASMVAELAGEPGRRYVQFYRESSSGLRDYDQVPLADLLRPWRLAGCWDAVVYPVVELEDDYPEEIFPGEFEQLQRWAQRAALGRVESVVEA